MYILGCTCCLRDSAGIKCTPKPAPRLADAASTFRPSSPCRAAKPGIFARRCLFFLLFLPLLFGFVGRGAAVCTLRQQVLPRFRCILYQRQQVLPAERIDLGAYFFNAYRQATRPDAARPHGQALSAYFFVFVVHLFSFFSAFFSVFVVHIFFPSFVSLEGAYFFDAYFSPLFFAFVGRGAAVCTPHCSTERPSAPAARQQAKSPETRINRGFARVCIFLKIFLKSSQVFFYFVFYSVYFSAYYICTGKRKADSPPNPFSPVFFYIQSSRRLQPCRHSARGCGCLYFCGEKRKKEKERKWRVSVSKKKEIFFAL